jgi:LPS sulfotransferase NodH
MNRFVIVTTGRTGSTALAKELDNHPNVTCHGEILRPGIFRGDEPIPSAAEVERLAATSPLPYRTFARLRPDEEPDPGTFSCWVTHLENHAEGKMAIGFKMVQGHSKGFEDFFDVLRTLRFRVLHMTRRNLLRQAISAMVARETKVFNATDYKPEAQRTFTFPPPEILRWMRKKIRRSAQYRTRLGESGLPVLDIAYEDFRDDKAGFYREVCDFLGVPFQVPEASAQSIMTPEPLRELLTNYDAVARSLKRNEMDGFLEDA